jgi:signal transduction histidine kinase
LTHPGDLDADLAYHGKMLSGEIPTYSLEKRYLRKDASVVWVNLTAAMVRTAAGDPEYFVSVVEDIGARKQAEEEVQQLNAELEQRVLDRTAQLEAANSELEAFSYSVSHDLRTPLRIVDGFSQALLEDHAAELSEQGCNHLRRVRNGVQRMAQLIDDLLKLSRISRAEMTVGNLNLSRLAESVVAELRAAEPERDVEVVIQPGLKAQGDERLMRVVLTNLVGNAWKFTSKRDDARIECGKLPDAEQAPDGAPQFATFYVRDNGAGFDMAYASKLFGAFQRLHSSKDFGGTGIGLATVKRIITRHGGSVWAEGEEGKGATIYFKLQSGGV